MGLFFSIKTENSNITVDSDHVAQFTSDYVNPYYAACRWEGDNRPISLADSLKKAPIYTVTLDSGDVLTGVVSVGGHEVMDDNLENILRPTSTNINTYPAAPGYKHLRLWVWVDQLEYSREEYDVVGWRQRSEDDASLFPISVGVQDIDESWGLKFIDAYRRPDGVIVALNHNNYGVNFDSEEQWLAKCAVRIPRRLCGETTYHSLAEFTCIDPDEQDLDSAGPAAFVSPVDPTKTDLKPVELDPWGNPIPNKKQSGQQPPDPDLWL